MVALKAGVVTLAVCLACTLLTFYGGREIYFQSVEREMLAIVQSASVLVDGNRHQKVDLEAGKSKADYEASLAPLQRILDTNDQIRYIYTCVQRGGRTFFVLDPTEPGDHDNDGIDDKSYVHEEYKDLTPGMAHAFRHHDFYAELEPSTDQWGTFISAYGPIRNSKNEFVGIVGVDIDFRVFLQRQDQLKFLLDLGIALCIAFATVVYLFVYRSTHKAFWVQTNLEAATEALEQANHDLAEGKANLEISVEKRTEELEPALAVKNQFLANMSHEMRTPLNGIIGMNMLMLETELSEEQQEYAELTQQSSMHLLQIISDILEIVRMRAGKQSLEVEPTNVNLAIQDACAALAISANRAGLKLDVELDDSIPLGVDGNALRLRQIVTNLVGNAIKFTNPPGWIKVITSAGTDSWALTVSDTGVGIDADKLHTIFEEFTQVDASATRRSGGTGLGLSITQNLVELLGGDISVESEPGVGTVFRVRLPYQKYEQMQAA